MSKPRAAIVYHPERGSLPRLRRIVAAAEQRAGYEPSLWFPTVAGGSAGDLAERAVDAGATLVIAAGGDGTVREVGTRLRGTGVPFGIVPTGTANLLARNLRIPLSNPVAATRIAFEGADRPIDVGLMDYRLTDGRRGEHPYLVIAGFGIDVDMVIGAHPGVKRRFGWIAYVAPILRSLGRRAGSEVLYAVDDGDPVAARLHTMMVGNCGTLTAGLRMLPEAVVDDGLLDVLAVRSFAGRDRGRIVRWLRPYNSPLERTPTSGAQNAREDAFRYVTAREVVVTLLQPTVLQADGDLVGAAEWAQFRVDPLALTVRVPAP